MDNYEHGERKLDITFGVNDGLDLHKPHIRVLCSILRQAIEDAIYLKDTNGTKYEATEWLCDEDNKLLQLCLFVANIDHDKILKKVATQGWNLDL